MKKLLFISILLAFKVIPSQAQEEFVEPASRWITTVPFSQLTGGIVLLKAQLDDHPDTLNFILDTGSSGISLDSSTAEYLDLKPIPSDRTIRGIAVMKKVSFLYDRTLKFPGLQIDSLDFHINDYSILTAVYGEQIDGIIGYSVLSRYIMKLNYDSAQLSFWTNGTIKYPRGGYLLRPVFNQLVAQPLRVKDDVTIHSRFLYDMGAGVCMLFNREFVEDSSFLDSRRKSWTKEGEGLGGKIDMELRVIKEVKIGPYRFRNVPSYVFNDEYNVTNYPYMGGLIGNDILRRFNVTLNYADQEIHIIPNGAFPQHFDYSYSGVELYLINGRIIIGDVAKGSPAEESGILEGDEVLGVNKNFSQNLNQYKIAMQVPNERIKIIVRREGQILEFEFKVRSIL
jgi:hypothetical protein